MSRCCELTGKSVQTGNNVSHSHRKTRRRFLPNLQVATLASEALNETVRIRLSMHALRSVEHKGGLDAFLINSNPKNLSKGLRHFRARVKRARSQAKSA